MRKMILLLGLLSTGIPIFSQQFAGTWAGHLQIPSGRLLIVFHVKDTASHYQVFMDSPDQNVRGIPATLVNVNENSISIEVANGGISYEGTLQADSMTGTFKQSGLSLPLILHKAPVRDEELKQTRPQEPKPPFPYRSVEVAFSNEKAEGVSISGTLTFPPSGNNFPAVILISGSGPQDRDETIFGHKPFLLIADHLTRKDIAVLRFDDRGTALSTGDFHTATSADFATDVEAAIRFLKRRTDIDTNKIGLIGHSEGGTIASMVAAEDKGIDFIILLASPGLPGSALLLSQNEALGKAAGMSAAEVQAAKELNQKLYGVVSSGGSDSSRRSKLIREMITYFSPLIPATQKQQMAEAQAAQLMSPWMQYFLKNDPADYLLNVSCPVLVLNGAKDLQVPVRENIAAIEEALRKGGNKRVTTRIFPRLNHLFQHSNTGMPSEYQQIEETMSPEVLDVMTNWIMEQIR